VLAVLILVMVASICLLRAAKKRKNGAVAEAE
jgi:hypothetical protein